MKTCLISFFMLIPLFALAQQKQNNSEAIMLNAKSIRYSADKDIISKTEIKDTLEIIISDSSRIIFISDSLDVFDQVKIDSLFRAVQKQMGGSLVNTGDTSVIKSFFLDSSKTPINKTPIAPYNKSEHGLFLFNISIAGGIFKNALLPGIIADFEYIPRGKKIGFFLEYQTYYLFSNNTSNVSFDLNNFAVAGIIFKKDSRSQLNKEFMSIGIGYGGQSDWEKGFDWANPLFKIYTSYNISSKYPISIAPELYIEKGFKKAYPGLTLKVGLF